MKRTLILTYYWPPGSGPGVQRWLKFCKYLPEYDWQPHVITVKNGSYPSTDPSLEDEVPSSLPVYKTSTLEPFRIYNMLRGKKGSSIEVCMSNLENNENMLSKLANYVRANYFIPDARVGWNRNAYRQAETIIREKRPEIILTTGPPHSTHLVGLRLYKKYGIPWVADFRDPWTTIYYNQLLNRNLRSERRDAELENQVLQCAKGVVVATPGLKEELQGRTGRIAFIPNGYDEEDFIGTEKVIPENKKLKLAYVGNLKSVQNNDACWSALSAVSMSIPLHIEITGNVAETVMKSIRHHGLIEVTDIRPFVPHKASITRMLQAHVLFLPIPSGGSSKRILTGKIFEYMATRRPIMGIGPLDGDAAKLLQECGKESMIAYDDSAGMERYLLKMFESIKAGHYQHITGNDNYKRYSRKGTTLEMAQFLENCLT